MLTHKNNYRLLHRTLTFILACLMALYTVFNSFALGDSATGTTGPVNVGALDGIVLH